MAKVENSNLTLLFEVEETPDNFMFFSDEKKKEWIRYIADLKNKEGELFTGISITKAQLEMLDDNFINFLKKNLKGKAFVVDLSYDAVLSPEEFKKVSKLKEEIESSKSSLYFHENLSYYDFDRVVEANAKLDRWANEIKNLKIDGKELSPLEKYYVAYSYVTRFSYKESKDGTESRNLISVLTGNNIVCVGYAQILQALCEKIGIECNTQMASINSNKANHMNCSVKLDDPKYGIKGVYYSDPCFDSIRNNVQEISFAHSLITYRDVPKLFRKEPIKVLSDSTFADINHFFKNEETIEKERENLSRFLVKFTDDFSKYIDDCMDFGYDHIFTKTPREKDFHEIIDKLITDRLDQYDYGSRKSPNKDYRGMTTGIDMATTAELIRKFTKEKNLDQFKAQLFESMKTYVPSYDSESFVTLSDAYTRLKNSFLDVDNKKQREEATELTFVNLEKLLENLEKIEGEMEVSTCKNTSQFIADSVNRATIVWGKISYGFNVYGRLKNKLYMSLGAGKKVNSGKQLVEMMREELENERIIPKKSQPTPVKPFNLDGEPKPFNIPKQFKIDDEPKPFVIPKQVKVDGEPKPFVIPKSKLKNGTKGSGESSPKSDTSGSPKASEEDFSNGKS